MSSPALQPANGGIVRHAIYHEDFPPLYNHSVESFKEKQTRML